AGPHRAFGAPWGLPTGISPKSSVPGPATEWNSSGSEPIEIPARPAGAAPSHAMKMGERGPPMSDEPGRLTNIAPVLRVVDLERSLAFYGDRLEFDLGFCYEESCASVSRDGGHLQCARPTPPDQADFERSESIY